MQKALGIIAFCNNELFSGKDSEPEEVKMLYQRNNQQ